MLPEKENNINLLIEQLGLSWHNPDLLLQALTHSSYSSENRQQEIKNNERLEFLGDAVLELLVSEILFASQPRLTEGELTKMRARVVCEPTLARIAREIGLGGCLRMSRGEVRSGGRDRPSMLADSFEALLGAVYLDQGLDAARSVVQKYLDPVFRDVVQGRLERDYKTDLQEILQQRSPDTVSYKIVHEEGPDHHKRFTAAVFNRGREMGRGSGYSKKEAEQKAAREALEKLELRRGT
ncbi:MAG: ribonuclease III [Bacillota bacterium]|jgi:ribonuclease-3